MEPVRVGATSFCIDRYEWPNRKGHLPRAYVSVFQAMDTCASAGKRLCTADEWTIACTGPYGWKYPYGALYERYACFTHDTTARPSGSRPECRGYFGIFDMSGNCAEWTSTRSAVNPRFYNVMGGFWESGPQSGCFDVRYSYFPQNRHNPVGFRCCKDAESSSAKRGAQ
jgi:formylglycine-generating enzyme required for sulfatase activity